ncbi:MAG TPA: HNH endonuclease signature motif containing protein [Kofleriaceae bacterium]|jgi:hypothetical protein
MFDGEKRVDDGGGEIPSSAGTRAELHRRRYYEMDGRKDYGSADQQALHARFVRRAKQRTAWDAEEARDLREAVRLRVWEAVSCANIVEYLERYSGLSPRVAQDRLRVPDALASLPNMEAALDEGLLHYSHVRELTRVATPKTEEQWLDAACGMTAGETMQAVSGRARGDRPTDPKRSELQMRTVSWRVREATAARIHALISELQSLHGDAFEDDDERLLAVCDAAECGGGLGGSPDEPGDAMVNEAGDAMDETGEAESVAGGGDDRAADGVNRNNDEQSDAPTSDERSRSSPSIGVRGVVAAGTGLPNRTSGNGNASRGRRASKQQSVGCMSCNCGNKPCNVGFSMRTPTQVWRTDDGRAFAYGVELAPEEAEYLLCNATDMGRVDDPHARATSRLTKRRRLRLMARDGNKCTVPGCRSRHNLDLHHILPREKGGDDSDANVTTLCSGHHRRLHEGRLDMKGTAPNDLMFSRPISDGLETADAGRAPMGTTSQLDDAGH